MTASTILPLDVSPKSLSMAEQVPNRRAKPEQIKSHAFLENNRSAKIIYNMNLEIIDYFRNVAQGCKVRSVTLYLTKD